MLISFAVTAKLICVFVFAYAKIRFSHVAAHFQIQLVGPIGPEILRLLPASVEVPSSSVIDKDEVHLIMEVRNNERYYKKICIQVFRHD